MSFGAFVLLAKMKALLIAHGPSTATKKRHTARNCSRRLLKPRSLPSPSLFPNHWAFPQEPKQPCRRSAVQWAAGKPLSHSDPAQAGSRPGTKGDVK
jgi:hypothetical protein